MRRGRSAWGSVSVALVVAVSLTSCTGAEDTAPDPDDRPAEGSADETGSLEPSGPAPDANEETGDELSGPSGRIELFGVQQVHPTRVLTGVTALTVDEHGNLLIDLESWNRGGLSTWLASRGSTRLEDDLGNTYEPVPPEEGWVNSFRLRLDQRAEMTVGFVGPIDAEATRVTLGLNAQDGFQDPAPEDRERPRFTFAELPLPGVGLDDEGVGDGQGGLDLRPTSIDIDGLGVELDDIGLVGVIEIRQVTVGPLSMEIDVYVRNEGDQPTSLRRQIQIVPEREGEPLPDYRFEYVRSVAGEEYWSGLEVQPGEEMEATLMFRAAMPRDADSFRIGFNQIRNEWLVRGDELPAMAREPTPSLYGVPLPDRTGGED